MKQHKIIQHINVSKLNTDITNYSYTATTCYALMGSKVTRLLLMEEKKVLPHFLKNKSEIDRFALYYKSFSLVNVYIYNIIKFKIDITKYTYTANSLLRTIKWPLRLHDCFGYIAQVLIW